MYQLPLEFYKSNYGALEKKHNGYKVGARKKPEDP
jgi:hypothetical protein